MKSIGYKNPYGIGLAAITLFILALLVITPYVIGIGLERWVTANSTGIGEVENVDFNPFSGRLTLDNLKVATKDGRTMTISRASLVFSWSQLFKKRLYLQELTLQDAYLLVDRPGEEGFRIGGFVLNGFSSPSGETEESGWEAGVDILEIANARIEYDTPELSATYFIDRYTLQGLETWNKERPVQMELNSRINESPVQVKAEVMPFGVAKDWKGSLRLQGGSLDLVSGMPGLQAYAPSGNITIDLKLDAGIQEDGVVILDAQGTVALGKLHMQYEGYSIEQEKIGWQGHVAAEYSADKGLKLEADGELTGESLLFADSEAALQLLLGDFTWQGETNMVRRREDFSLTMAAGFNGNKVRVNRDQINGDLLNLEKFTLTGIRIANLEDIRVTQIDFANLHLLEKTAANDRASENAVLPLLQTSAAIIDSFSLQPGKNITVGNINLADLQADIHRDAEGSWQLGGKPTKNPAAGEEGGLEQDHETADKTTFTLNVDNLVVEGESFVNFEDESLARPFRTKFHIEELTMTGLDTAKGHPPAAINLKGSVGDYGSVALGGTVNPAEDSIDLDLKGRINGLNMVPFTSYTGMTTGYNVSSGQMDADIDLAIDKGMIDGSFDLRMRRLEVARVDPEKEPEIDAQMDVPLETALSMLRDKNNEINLELELKGDIKSPEFGIQDAINQALGKALKFATVSYLKYALQPFGTYLAIAQVVGKAGQAIAKVRLDPMTFPAGEAALDETASQYLAKVQEVLDNRPKLGVELCPKAVPADRTVLVERKQAEAAGKSEDRKDGAQAKMAGEETRVTDETLLDLARKRAELVKDRLVNQHGINHERIYVCLPEIDEAPDKEPYVELLLD